MMLSHKRKIQSKRHNLFDRKIAANSQFVNYIQAALKNNIPDLFVSVSTDGYATYTIEDPVTRERVEFNPYVECN